MFYGSGYSDLQRVLKVREKTDVSIFIDFPHKMTANTKVVNLLRIQTNKMIQVYVRAPVIDKRGVFNLEKFKMFQDIPQFGAYGVLGTHRDIIVDEVYEIEHINSDRSETHMQHDTLYGDFGYMTSHGYDW